MVDTPVLFIIFNRPDVTGLVFDEIKKARPKHLFVAADGPRLNRPDDEILCQKTRNIIHQVDWPCEVKTLFREKNLGCGKAVSSAISWFFSQVEEGIILEDDCLPHPSFFAYCEELLAFYRNDPRVMHIGGVNFQQGHQRGEASYYFSAVSHVWGWATWRRAWELYNFNVSDFYTFVREGTIYHYFSNETLANHWLEQFRNMYYHKIDTWDHQWSYTVFKNGGLSIVPNTNLISNIGFREDATHTSSSNSVYANAKTSAITSIQHPAQVALNREADFYFFSDVEKLPILERSWWSSLYVETRSLMVRTVEYLLRSYVFSPKIKNPGKTLLIQKTDAVGDYIITRNFFKALIDSETYKGYTVYLLANIRLKTWIEETDMAWFKDVIYFDGNDLQHLKSKYAFYYKLRKLKIQTLIHATFSRSVISDDIVFHAGAPINIGFLGDTSNISAENKAVTDTYYSRLIDVDKILQNPFSHEFEKQKTFFESIINKSIFLQKPDLTDRIKPEQPNNIISLFPGSHEVYKMWDTGHFSGLIQSLSESYGDYQFKVVCGPHEQEFGERIRSSLPQSILNRVEVISTTSILNLGIHLAKSRLVVANDSAPVHIAVALTIPVVCVFNGTKYGRFVPYPTAISTACVCVVPEAFRKEIETSAPEKQVYYRSISSYSINSVTIEDVVEACHSLLNT